MEGKRGVRSTGLNLICIYIYIYSQLCVYIYAYVSVISVYHILSVYLSSVYLSISLKSLKPNEYSLDT